MSGQKKDKRRFRRYRTKLDFKLSVDEKPYHATAIDYSVDGICAEMEDGPQLQIGDVIEIEFSNSNINIKGEVAGLKEVTMQPNSALESSECFRAPSTITALPMS